MSSLSFYSAVKSFSMFDDMLRTQPDNPTKRLNDMLRKGVSLSQLEDLLSKSYTKQFSFIGEGWKGIRRHIRFCEKNGWVFSVDFDQLLSRADRNQVIKITGFDRPNSGTKRNAIELASDNTKFPPKNLRLRLSEILSTVTKNIAGRIDSLDPVYRFYRTGIEGWFKVEVVAALGDQVLSLNNRGPDITLTDGFLLELKAATDFNPPYLRDGALKDSVPCMFLGDGEHRLNIERLESMSEISVIGIEYIYGKHTWVLGCIVPIDYE